MKVIIRVDASSTLGGGHVLRCLTLAHLLTRHGYHCCFAVRPGSVETVPILKSDALSVITLSKDVKDEVSEIRELLGSCDWLIIDHYQLDRAYEEQARSFAKYIMVIDDLANRAHDCDLLLDQTYGRQVSDYHGLIPQSAKLLRGAEFALLRPEFPELRAEAIEKRKAPSCLNKVLISMGASDPQDMTAKILRAIKKSNLDVDVDVTIGNEDPVTKGLTDIAHSMPQKINFYGFDANIAELMLNADLAIGAGGATSWERCSLGLPTLLIVTADNQMVVAKNLEQHGAVKYIGTASSFTGDSLIDQLQLLANQTSSLTDMSDVAFRICNGKGALKVFVEMCLVMRKRRDRISLRPTVQEDSDDILTWQKNPTTRALFRNSEAPTREEHNAWFERKQNDPNCIFLSILYDEKFVGVIRLDRHFDNIRYHKCEYEVSIVISPDYRGKGVGKTALKICREAFPYILLKADVHPDNIASQNIFLAAGFTACLEGSFMHPGHS